MALGVGDEIGVGQAGTEEHRRNDHGEEQRRDQASAPGQEAIGDVGQDRVGRGTGPLVRVRRRGTLGGQEAAHIEEGGGAGNNDDGAERQGPFPVLAGDPAGEDDGDQAVGANDVTGEEHGVHGAEEDHPQATAPHQATSVHGGLLTGPGRLLRRRLTAVLHAGQGAEVGRGTGGDAPVDHGDQSEAEEHREQRVGARVDQEGAHPQPCRVDRIRRGGSVRHIGPEGDVGQGDEQEHEATGHIRGRIAHPPSIGE